MAFRRFRRRPFRKTGNRYRKKVPRPIVSFVKKQINKNLEYKYHTAYYAVSGGVPNNGAVTALIDIKQGVLDTDRIGDEIKMRTITFRYVVTVADSHNYVRFILFQMKSPNNVGPGVTYVLNGSAPTYLSQYSVDNRSNFNILYDRTTSVDADDPAKVVIGKANMKYCKRKMQFQAGSNILGTNMIYALAISDSSSTSHPSITGEINFWYTDA